MTIRNLLRKILIIETLVDRDDISFPGLDQFIYTVCMSTNHLWAALRILDP